MIKFKYNHVGYAPSAPKIFVIDSPEELTFRIQTVDEGLIWKDVFSGELVQSGDHYIGDFSSVTTPADYRICCGTDESCNFVIKEDPYLLLERLLTTFYTWQRCGSPKGWAGICHQELDTLYGTGKKLDMRGGYHQSCDLRCWHDGCSSALYGYLRYAEESHPLWENGLFEEELRWGLDYFRRTVSPEGFIYDCQFVPLGWGHRDYYNSPAPLCAHYNICRLLARGSRYFRKSDPAFASELLAKAEKIWTYVEKTPFDTPYVPPVKELPRGTQGANFYWQNRKNCAGMDCASSAAARDLYLAAGKEEYLQRARMDMDKVLRNQIVEGEAGGIFRDRLDNDRRAFQDCSYGHNHSGMVFLADLIREEQDDALRGKYLEAFLRYADMIVREFSRFPLSEGIPMPCGKNFLGELPKAPPLTDSPIPLVHHRSSSTSLAASFALILSAAKEFTGKKEYAFYAQHGLDFLLGCNPLAASSITGIGFNHTMHNVFGQFFPSTPQIPGGVNTMVSGEYDLPVAGLLLRVLAKFRKNHQSGAE